MSVDAETIVRTLLLMEQPPIALKVPAPLTFYSQLIPEIVKPASSLTVIVGVAKEEATLN